MFRLVIITCSLLIFYLSKTLDAAVETEAKWGYRNLDVSKPRSILPEDWHQVKPECKGNLQSPINIDFASTSFDVEMKEILIKKKEANGSIWNITNIGSTVKLIPNDCEFTFTMHPQNEVFNLLQLHFHWRGSEHFIDDKKFAAEVHLVFQSATNPDQFSVVGYVFKLVNKDNQDFKPLFKQIKTVKAFGSVTQFDFQLEKLLPMKVANYYRYSGSLTTPGCNEIVEWNVVDSPVLGLSENQLLEFQSLLDVDGLPILSNSRPVQNLNDRTVRRSFYPFHNRRVVDSASGQGNGAQGLKFIGPICYCLLLNAYYLIMV